MSIILAGMALKAGLPVIEKLLSRKLGDANGRLAAEVLGRIAGEARVSPEEIEKVAEAEPGKIIDAMRAVNAQATDVLAIYAAGLEGQFALLQAETAEGGWKSAWRPAGMYMLGFLWLWNVVLLHVANAIWKVALPPVPFQELIQLSGLYMALYMGGHTVKDVVAKWGGK